MTMKIVGTIKYDDGVETFETTLPTRFLWVVYKHWPTGMVERVAAFYQEQNAREFAAKLVGKDKATIGLETISVHDDPKEA
jgi:hypothetical protein